MAIEWKYLLDKLETRPTAVLLGLSLGLATWALLGWRDEVKDHKEDLRKSNIVLQQTNELQYKMLILIQEKNSKQWKTENDSIPE